MYAGMLTGAVPETASHLTDGDLIDTYLNWWHGDKLLHIGFTYGLNELALRGLHKSSDALYTAADTIDHDWTADKLETAAYYVTDPGMYHAALTTTGVVATFSLTKEWHDSYADMLDVAANAAGGAASLAQEYRRQASTDPEDVYDDVRNELRSDATEDD